jgi:deoxyribodipyrimidine photo-lyase
MFGVLRDLPCTFIESIEELPESIGSVQITTSSSPFARDRLVRYHETLGRRGITLHVHLDELGPSVLRAPGQPYVVFGPYWKKVKAWQPDTRPVTNIAWRDNELRRRLTSGCTSKSYRNALKIPYNKDIGLSISSFIRFGVVSMREAWKLVPNHEFRRQLAWRGFYHAIMTHKQGYLMPPPTKYKAPKELTKWIEGRTGCEIVDVAMKYLVRTGHLPNRMRMIVAAYLIDTMHIPWWWGAEVFERYLEDYDWAVNTGNWLWIDGSVPWGRAPYERFSMERQAQRPEVIAFMRMANN